MSNVHIFPSPLGYFGVLCNGHDVWRLTFGHASSAQALYRIRSLWPVKSEADGVEFANSEIPVRTNGACRLLQRYAAGEKVNLAEIPVCWDRRSHFQRRVIEACRKIPYGGVATYSQLAAQAGSPRAARAVGTIMSNNPVPLLVPCHRVVAAGGGMGGYSAPHGIKMKRRLLDLESAACATAPANR